MKKNQLLVYLCYGREFHTQGTSILAQLKCEKIIEKYFFQTEDIA